MMELKENVQGMLSNAEYMLRQEETESNARSYPRKFPFSLVKAKGVRLTDVEGNEYLDFLCGAGTLALGHNDPEVNQVMVDMLTSDRPLHTLDLMTPVKHDFVQSLFSLLPEELRKNAKVQFCSPSGTDATDAAIKLCKTATGRSAVIAFHGGYHGMGHGAMALTGNLSAKSKVPALMPDVHFMPYPYDYRCPFGLGGEAGTKACCEYFDRMLKDPESNMSAGHARALLGLNDKEMIPLIAKRIAEKALSVREVEALIKRANMEPAPELPEIQGNLQNKTWMKDLERRTREILGRKVKITQNDKKRSIELFYDDDDDMEALLTLLCGADFFQDEE